ncbi:MAG: AAA family ATPase, partial [Cyclobacteriaceae bacterium]|nr:AAA family ATPase [Cyclobacteriaceae bacterium]
KLNEFIKRIWINYDQELKISLEENQILIQFYDPKNGGGGYYEMQERSQGCKTFISFLLTVAAEANNNVLKNTILLLDEPETHLHPSGVRYMLNELIKVCKNENKVIFATHSIFMIDQDNYDRHVIVEKTEEKTIIKPSRKNRIGYFMQEEVLYSALNFKPKNDFKFDNQLNFVFEGDADTRLFTCFHDQMKKSDQIMNPKDVSYYQGGKCSDILKYFRQIPLQLGTIWVFIIDNDEPANKLREFLEKKYASFMEKCIFVFQYYKDKKNKDIELEDLLPSEIIYKSLEEAISSTGLSIDLKKVTSKKQYKIISENLKIELDEGQQSRFIPAFKSNLNMKVRELCEKQSNNFEEVFSEYSLWATETMKSLASRLKPNQ